MSIQNQQHVNVMMMLNEFRRSSEPVRFIMIVNVCAYFSCYFSLEQNGDLQSYIRLHYSHNWNGRNRLCKTRVSVWIFALVTYQNSLPIFFWQEFHRWVFLRETGRKREDRFSNKHLKEKLNSKSIWNNINNNWTLKTHAHLCSRSRIFSLRGATACV